MLICRYCRDEITKSSDGYKSEFGGVRCRKGTYHRHYHWPEKV